jgi:hypothetical protein
VPPNLPVAAAEYRGFIKSLHPIKVYEDRGNVVVVQKIDGGVESGKYIVPFVSSHFPFGGEGGFTLAPATGCPSCIYQGPGAVVYDYRKGQ